MYIYISLPFRSNHFISKWQNKRQIFPKSLIQYAREQMNIRVNSNELNDLRNNK